MTEDGNSLSRRKVIASAGAGMGTGLLAQLAPQPAAAQDLAAKHAAPMKSNRQLFWHVMRAFLTMPAHTEV